MDLSQYLPNEAGATADVGQKLSKEEYAALKKQEREELWAEIDAKAQEVFKDGESLKGFLDFMAQCKPQKVANLLLLYSQNPEIRQVKTFDGWKKEHKTLKAGVHGYTFIADQAYEKDGETRQGYTICKAYDISQVRTRQPEEQEPKPMGELMTALLKNSSTRISIADNLPESVQAQYIPGQRTIFVRNGMSEEATFHAINRELACASLDAHNGTYSRAAAAPQAFCTAYVVAQKYGVSTAGFRFDKVCEIQGNGSKDPQELRNFISDVKNSAYRIARHMDQNLGEPEQEFMPDEFAVSGESENTPKDCKDGKNSKAGKDSRENNNRKESNKEEKEMKENRGRKKSEPER
ncbi:hypothetical protein C817_02150 [Dorea sp. 5-2]|nr:hypothetical protein C817_02150 [Dorea sp. 5-2]